MKKTNHLVAGIADGLRCVGLIRASSLPTRNRLAFLTADSVLEISLRIFLQHKKRIKLDPVKHRPRHILFEISKKNLTVDDTVWEHLTYCYENIRCPLYHEASDMTVSDTTLDEFSETICFLVNEMFKFDSVACIAEGRGLTPQPEVVASPGNSVDPNRLQKVDAIVLSLGMGPKPDSASIFQHLRSLGFTAKLPTNAISAYLSQGRYFHKDPSDGLWKLTELVGRKCYAAISEDIK